MQSNICSTQLNDLLHGAARDIVRPLNQLTEEDEQLEHALQDPMTSVDHGLEQLLQRSDQITNFSLTAMRGLIRSQRDFFVSISQSYSELVQWMDEQEKIAKSTRAQSPTNAPKETIAPKQSTNIPPPSLVNVAPVQQQPPKKTTPTANLLFEDFGSTNPTPTTAPTSSVPAVSAPKEDVLLDFGDSVRIHLPSLIVP